MKNAPGVSSKEPGVQSPRPRETLFVRTVGLGRAHGEELASVNFGPMPLEGNIDATYSELLWDESNLDGDRNPGAAMSVAAGVCKIAVFDFL